MKELELAAQRGEIPKAQQVLERGRVHVDDALDWNDRAALAMAVVGNQPPMMEYLIKEWKCDLNKQNKSGWTALHVAAFWKHDECMKLLLQYGADKGIKDKKGRTALDLVIQNSNTESIELLKDDSTKQASSQVAPKTGSSSSIPEEEISKEFANTELDADEEKKELKTAAREGDIPNAQQILERRKVRVDDGLDKYEMTALMFAVIGNHPAMMEYLINEWKCNVNKQTNGGNTAVHVAASFERKECTELLLKHGADKKIKNKRGKTALDIAKGYGGTELIELLKDESTKEASTSVAPKTGSSLKIPEELIKAFEKTELDADEKEECLNILVSNGYQSIARTRKLTHVHLNAMGITQYFLCEEIMEHVVNSSSSSSTTTTTTSTSSPEQSARKRSKVSGPPSGS